MDSGHVARSSRHSFFPFFSSLSLSLLLSLHTVSPSTLLPLQLGFSHLQDQRQHEHIQEENLTQRCIPFFFLFFLFQNFPHCFIFPFSVKFWICVQNSNFSFLSELDLVFVEKTHPGLWNFKNIWALCC